MGERLVIDISSDDPQNKGVAAAAIRQKAIDEGITINGLPILIGRLEHEERAELVNYYRQHVIGGPGAFMIPALSRRHYADAMLKKLISEIAGLPLSKLDG